MVKQTNVYLSFYFFNSLLLVYMNFGTSVRSKILLYIYQSKKFYIVIQLFIKDMIIKKNREKYLASIELWFPRYF